METYISVYPWMNLCHTWWLWGSVLACSQHCWSRMITKVLILHGLMGTSSWPHAMCVCVCVRFFCLCFFDACADNYCTCRVNINVLYIYLYLVIFMCRWYMIIHFVHEPVCSSTLASYDVKILDTGCPEIWLRFWNVILLIHLEIWCKKHASCVDT